MSVSFISDLHLDIAHPKTISAFIEFLNAHPPHQPLYILGDFFEIWVGDDAIDDWHQAIIKALRHLSDQGTAIYFMPGNRDFFIGARFLKQCGMTLLTDPHVLQLHGQKTLLMHGDTLCTDDVAYQRFRKFIRNPIVKRIFLMLPKHYRLQLAEKARDKSRRHTQQTEAAIMDVNTQTVAKIIEKYNVTRLIHGHTHRPIIERQSTARGHAYQRIVLGAWHQQTSVLTLDDNGEPHLSNQPIA